MIDDVDTFGKALRSFQAGGIGFGALLARLDRELAAGVPADVLLEALRQRERAAPLAEEFRMPLLARLASDASEDETIVLDVEPPGRGSDAPRVGDVLLDRYRLLEVIGSGATSQVYLAEDLGAAGASPARIALKLFTGPLEAQFGSFTDLQRSIEKLAALAHPNIARLRSCERAGARVFATMEYVPGNTLFDVMSGRTALGSRGALGADAARYIVSGIAQALEFAHRHGVVHGDLKPGNVMLSEQGTIKVIDFGLARWRTHATPRYASPQVMNRQPATSSDDVYALACLAYELLTGHQPIGGAPPRSPLTKAEHRALVHGMQGDAAQRTPTVAQFIAEFTARDIPASVAPPAGAPPTAAPPTAAPPTAAPAAPSRTRGLRVLMAAAALAAAAAAVILLVMWRKPVTEAVPATARSVGQNVPASSAPRRAPANATPTAAEAGAALRDCPTCPLLRVIPAGAFIQGAAGAGASRFQGPPHRVTIQHAFALGAHDVTVAEFGEFVAATHRPEQGCDTYDGAWHHRGSASWRAPGFAQTALHPATCISWLDASAYAEWLSHRTGRRYRLPSAAEWEYAARAGGTGTQPWKVAAAACLSADVADRSAARRYPGWRVFDCDDHFVHTAPVGSFTPNALGLDDMLGNVFQWTADCWQATYAGAPTDGAARTAGDCGERELRGGSWFTAPEFVTAAYRNHFPLDYRTSTVGFRVARELPP